MAVTAAAPPTRPAALPAALPAVLLAALTWATLVTLASAAAVDEWSNEAMLASDGSVRIKWRIGDGNFTCQLTADTLGWIGFGLSPNGGMKNSDMIVAGVKDGKPYLTDMHSLDGYYLQVDQRQDCHLLAGWETDQSTTVVFTRRLMSSCDPGQVDGEDRDITADTQHVLYGVHSRDPDQVTAPARHERRGQRSIHLTDQAGSTRSTGSTAASEPSMTRWSARQAGVRLPVQHTVYWCAVVRAPLLTTKHHVISYRPVITAGNERVVHHMVLYQCSGRDFSDLERHVGSGGYHCYTANMPPVAHGCRGVIAGWGIGGQEFVYPDGVGYPVGADHAQYYILEVHYDLGPNSTTETVDSSGLEFTLTAQLRQHDSSMLTLGHDTSQLLVVPPHVSQHVIGGHCSDECLDLALPEAGVTAFAALPHTHLLGRQIRLRHFRRGRELPPIVRDDAYDFNYQQLRHVPQRQLLRGDQLTVECVYRSDRDTVTLGGLSTQEEMCIVFLQYYPAIELAQCVSTPRQGDLLATLGVNHVTRSSRYGLQVEDPPAFRGATFQAYLDQLTWTKEMVSSLQQVARDGTHVPECYNFGRHLLSTTRNTTRYPPGAKKQGWLHRAAICENSKNAGGATYRAASALLAACWLWAAAAR